MSRIVKKNERYLARVQNSLAKERDTYVDKVQATERLAAANDRYSDMWISSHGPSVSPVIHMCRHGVGDISYVLNSSNIKIYSHTSNEVQHMNLITLIKILIDQNFPELRVSRTNQVNLNDFSLPSRIYEFLRWHGLQT